MRLGFASRVAGKLNAPPLPLAFLCGRHLYLQDAGITLGTSGDATLIAIIRASIVRNHAVDHSTDCMDGGGADGLVGVGVCCAPAFESG